MRPDARFAVRASPALDEPAENQCAAAYPGAVVPSHVLDSWRRDANGPGDVRYDAAASSSGPSVPARFTAGPTARASIAAVDAMPSGGDRVWHDGD